MGRVDFLSLRILDPATIYNFVTVHAEQRRAVTLLTQFLFLNKIISHYHGVAFQLPRLGRCR
jgi:hypothetical protein